MNFCIYEILYSTEALLGSSSGKRVQGERFSLVGFLGLKVLSGGLGRVTPAVGLEVPDFRWEQSDCAQCKA